MAQTRANINHCPKIYWDFEKDQEGKELDNGDMYLAIELEVPAPFFERQAGPYGGKESYLKVMSPL